MELDCRRQTRNFSSCNSAIQAGSYEFDLTYLDAGFNLFSERVAVQVFDANANPELSIANTEVIINSKPFANVEISDDRGIESIEIILDSGFSEELIFDLDHDPDDGISISWDSELNAISLVGDASVAEFNKAIQEISIQDTSSTSSLRKKVEINVTDKSEVEIFRNTTSDHSNMSLVSRPLH